MPTTSDSTRSEVRRTADRLIVRLQKGYLADDSAAVGQLARLRTGDLADPVADPRLWALTFEALPDVLVGSGDEPSRGELAVHAAVTLYAVHQQGRRDHPMHVADSRFGSAVRRLALAAGQGGDMSPGVLTRFQHLCLSYDRRLRLNHLRSLVTMLRGEQIPVDYGRLAADLYDLESVRTRSSVHLQWARDFHRRSAVESKDAATTTTHPEES